MGEPTQGVKLKNGATEFGHVIAVLMKHLEGLLETSMGTGLYELVEICKDPNHKPWGQTGDDIKNRQLASEYDGKWHVSGTIRNIVQSAVEGEGLAIRLVNPIAETVATDSVPATA